MDIEFLPGKTLTADASLRFTDKDVAEYSLAHIQKTYPQARLASYADVRPVKDAGYTQWLDMRKKRTEYFRERYLSN